jgi:hypothetical protein
LETSGWENKQTGGNDNRFSKRSGLAQRAGILFRQRSQAIPDHRTAKVGELRNGRHANELLDRADQLQANPKQEDEPRRQAHPAKVKPTARPAPGMSPYSFTQFRKSDTVAMLTRAIVRQ